MRVRKDYVVDLDGQEKTIRAQFGDEVLKDLMSTIVFEADMGEDGKGLYLIESANQDEGLIWLPWDDVPEGETVIYGLEEWSVTSATMEIFDTDGI